MKPHSRLRTLASVCI